MKEAQRLSTERLDREMKASLQEAMGKKQWADDLKVTANRHFDQIMPMLRRRGIKVLSSQTYFNDTLWEHKKEPALTVHVAFAEDFASWDSPRCKRLNAELRKAGIPATANLKGLSMTVGPEGAPAPALRESATSFVSQ